MLRGAIEVLAKGLLGELLADHHPEFGAYDCSR
jgi:hypothetical protein